MAMLMRAPEECVSWDWESGHFAPPGLVSALSTAARMSALLRDHGLLEPSRVEWRCFVYVVGGIGIKTTLPVMVRIYPADLAQRIERSQPSGYPGAQG